MSEKYDYRYYCKKCGEYKTIFEQQNNGYRCKECGGEVGRVLDTRWMNSYEIAKAEAEAGRSYTALEETPILKHEDVKERLDERWHKHSWVDQLTAYAHEGETEEEERVFRYSWFGATKKFYNNNKDNFIGRLITLFVLPIMALIELLVFLVVVDGIGCICMVVACLLIIFSFTIVLYPIFWLISPCLADWYLEKWKECFDNPNTKQLVLVALGSALVILLAVRFYGGLFY